jgi:hypothetical protein
VRRAATALAVIAAIAWSLAAWGAYAFVGWAGAFLAAHADQVAGDPYVVVWLAWIVGAVTSVGLIGVVLVWVAGLGLIALIPLAARLIAGRSAAPHPFDRNYPGNGPNLPRTAEDVIRRVIQRVRR